MPKPDKSVALFAERSPFGVIPFTPARYVVARALWVTLVAMPPALMLLAELLPTPEPPAGWLLAALAAVPTLLAAEYLGGLTFPGRIGPRLSRPELRHLRHAYRAVLVLTWGVLAGAALMIGG